jgi:mannobiose 2-epimerase
MLKSIVLLCCFSSAACELRVQLEEKILPYWFDTAQDASRGGYLLNDDEVQGRKQPVEKQIVSQSRMIWGFSHVHRAGFTNADRNYLQAAKQGYQFLLDHFLDRINGGYFWSTDCSGSCLNSGKFLYGQSFVIYALVDYYRASGDLDALLSALDLYRKIQAHLHDNVKGGWFEQAERNWKLLPPGDPRNLFQIGNAKTANAHLHWMEALTELYDASRDSAVRASLVEVLRLNQTYFWPENPAQSAAYCDFDWKPRSYKELSYGHNVEYAWLMIRAETILDQKPSWNRFYALLDHALKYGYDNERGGLYKEGCENQPAHVTEKVWWSQAEMLAALTDALAHRDDLRYKVALDKLLQFIKAYQASPKDAIWLSSVTASGEPLNTSRANSWKANYHDVRAMLKFIETFSLSSTE